NQNDAFLANLLGDVNFEQGDVAEARIYYEDAWRIDPKNNLDYMYDLIVSNGEIDDYEIIAAINLAKEYQVQLANNAHLTILSGNPDAAVLIYEALINVVYEAEDSYLYNMYYKDLKKGLELMEETYLDEKGKFEHKYGIELKKE
ncbi:hypothetical protein KKD70_01845, partial [Patescibacteria group bacterium]|nr:hypothetical protein [Patescibacteria group bacterium]